jgi:hypothetical protein
MHQQITTSTLLLSMNEVSFDTACEARFAMERACAPAGRRTAQPRSPGHDARRDPPAGPARADGRGVLRLRRGVSPGAGGCRRQPGPVLPAGRRGRGDAAADEHDHLHRPLARGDRGAARASPMPPRPASGATGPNLVYAASDPISPTGIPITMTRHFVLGTAISAVLALPAFAQDLLVFDYSGFENPDFHQPFVNQYGGSPEFVFFGDEDEAFQRLLAGFRSDVTQICAGSVPRWQESGIIEPWDRERIAAYDTLNANLVGQDVLAGSADLFFLPFNFGSTAIAYNSDEVPGRGRGQPRGLQQPRLCRPPVDPRQRRRRLCAGLPRDRRDRLVGRDGRAVRGRDRVAARHSPEPPELLGRPRRDPAAHGLGPGAGRLGVERGSRGAGRTRASPWASRATRPRAPRSGSAAT